MFKNMKGIEFEKVNENGETSYFVKADGTQASMFERFCLIALCLFLGFGYVAFRMLIGVLLLIPICAIFFNHFLKGDTSFVGIFLLMIKDIRIVIFGCLIGLGIWLSEMA